MVQWGAAHFREMGRGVSETIRFGIPVLVKGNPLDATDRQFSLVKLGVLEQRGHCNSPAKRACRAREQAIQNKVYSPSATKHRTESGYRHISSASHSSAL